MGTEVAQGQGAGPKRELTASTSRPKGVGYATTPGRIGALPSRARSRHRIPARMYCIPWDSLGVRAGRAAAARDLGSAVGTAKRTWAETTWWGPGRCGEVVAKTVK